MVGDGRDELTATEKLERRLDPALRQAGIVGERTQAGLDWLPVRARGLAVKKKVNQIRRRLAIVPNDIAQQDVENVIVDRDRFAETRHDEIRNHEGGIKKKKMPALPINGQCLGPKSPAFFRVAFLLGMRVAK
jgi:hypothetical protein